MGNQEGMDFYGGSKTFRRITGSGKERAERS